MQDDCLLELHEVLQPEARQVFVILIAMGSANREQLMQVGQLTTQRVRKAIWGLANTGLIVQKRQEPLRLSPQRRATGGTVAYPGRQRSTIGIGGIYNERSDHQRGEYE
jgi:hypothetical protein